MTSIGLPGGFFQGTMDEVRIWNVARTAAEIQGAMGGPLATPAPNLLGRWAANEGAGTTTADSSGRNINGTLTGGPTWVAGTPFVHTPLPPGNYAVKFAGTVPAGDYATLGAAPISAPRRSRSRRGSGVTAPGVATSTGSGGIDAIPLVTKGRAEGESSNVDMNYFLGIRATDGVLVADFEEGPPEPIPG